MDRSAMLKYIGKQYLCSIYNTRNPGHTKKLEQMNFTNAVNIDLILVRQDDDIKVYPSSDTPHLSDEEMIKFKDAICDIVMRVLDETKSNRVEIVIRDKSICATTSACISSFTHMLDEI